MLAAAPAVFGGEVLRFSVPWLPALGLDFGLRLDGLAWLFALLITGIGALVVLYAAWYLDPADPAPRFFTFLLLFMGAMLGVVLADNLILLVLFWELTSLSSFLLIGYWHGARRRPRRARAWRSPSPAPAACACWPACCCIGHIAGSTQLDVVLAAGDVIRAHPLYETALVLVLLGAFTKSAQFPFHFWLPHAMAAPTPVSAYLHSATMVKAGVFLLARLYPALGGSEPWFWIVTLRRAGDAADRRLRGDLPARPEGPAGLQHHQPPGPDHAAVRPGRTAGGGGRRVPHHQPRHLQGGPVHERRHHRPRVRHARHAAHQRPAASTCPSPPRWA